MNIPLLSTPSSNGKKRSGQERKGRERRSRNLSTLLWVETSDGGFVLNAARVVSGSLRAGPCPALWAKPGTIVVSWERPSVHQTLEKPGGLRTWYLRESSGGIGFPVSWGAKAGVAGNLENLVGLGCRVGLRRWSAVGGWQASSWPLSGLLMDWRTTSVEGIETWPL